MYDSYGEALTFPLSHFSALQREVKVRILKSQFIQDKDQSENVFQTFSYPFEGIIQFNPSFDIHTIQRIDFVFDKMPKGVIIVDDIGFMKQ